MGKDRETWVGKWGVGRRKTGEEAGRGEKWPREREMERDRQDRERTVSPFMRKGSLQIKMTSFSCAALLIPMNSQLNAEVADETS